jgi:hypothetical protein
MKTKKIRRRAGNRGGNMRTPKQTKAGRKNAKRRTRPKSSRHKTISFHARHNEIHDSLDHVIGQIESTEMNPESAKEILKKIAITQTLLRAARQELETWLKG